MSSFTTTIQPPKFRLNIIAILGDYFKYEFTWRSNPQKLTVTPSIQDRDDLFPVIDVTNYTALLQIKDAATDATSKLELTDVAGITLDGANKPNITWEMSAAQITALAVGKYVYEMQLTDTLGHPTTVFGGDLTIQQDITR